MDETTQELVTGTLAWCNEKREERNMAPLDDLPKGERGNGDSCPCGKATGLRVGTETYHEPQGTKTWPLPLVVRNFVEAFDDGEIPEYVEVEKLVV